MKPLEWCTWAVLLAPTLALAGRLGVVQFANGSVHPTKIAAGLVAQAQAARKAVGA